MPVTNYIYDPVTEAYLMETDGDGNMTAWYTQEPVKYGDIHAQRRIDPTTGVGKSYYYHPDALGSTREPSHARRFFSGLRCESLDYSPAVQAVRLRTQAWVLLVHTPIASCSADASMIPSAAWRPMRTIGWIVVPFGA